MKTKQPKKPVPKEVSEYMSSLAKKVGDANKKKGSEYFRWVAAHRKDVKHSPEDIGRVE